MPTDRNIKFIAFDADDTLWENEIYLQELEHNFCNLLSNHMPESVISRELLNTEIKNLHLYGYGLKSMMLSMIETACRISKGKTAPGLIETIINQGQLILQKPVTLLNGVTETLETLSQKYKLVMATKGDLLDQQRKIKSSGIEKFFYHTEILNDKKAADYKSLLSKLNCPPDNFLMVGNSIKSDVLPVLEIGGYAAYIPYRIIWQHEKYEGDIQHPNFFRLKQLKDITTCLNI